MTSGFHKRHTAKRSETRFHKEIVYGPRLEYDIQKTRAQVPLTEQILHLHPDCGFVPPGKCQDTTSFGAKCFLPDPFQCIIHHVIQCYILWILTAQKPHTSNPFEVITITTALVNLKP
jgi:hypothetical protein